MPDLLLQVWKLVLLAFIYLFFFRVLRAIWATLRTPTAIGRPPVAPVAPAPRPAKPVEGGRGVNRLKVLQPPEQAGVVYEVEEELTIGRAAGCKVNIDDTFVSQLHARVFRRDGQVMIEDLGSTNGTFKDGNKVAGPTPIQKGDRIQVGRTVLEAVR